MTGPTQKQAHSPGTTPNNPTTPRAIFQPLTRADCLFLGFMLGGFTSAIIVAATIHIVSGTQITITH